MLMPINGAWKSVLKLVLNFDDMEERSVTTAAGRVIALGLTVPYPGSRSPGTYRKRSL